QAPDGIWPIGAPLDFDRETQSGIYVANIEIINAILPLFEKYSKNARHYECLDRIFNWLATNYRRVKSKNLKAEIWGWAADKIVERGRIDVWMTALVLEFLFKYRRILQDFINRSTLERSEE